MTTHTEKLMRQLTPRRIIYCLLLLLALVAIQAVCYFTSPDAFFKTYKLNRAAEMIREGKEKLSYIAELTGFCGSSHFAASFKKQFGVLPSEYATHQG